MKGLYRFDRENEKFIHFVPSGNIPEEFGHIIVTNISEDENGTLWFGSNLGLMKCNPVDNTITHYNYPGQIFKDPLGRDDFFWLTAYDAVYLFNKTTGTAVSYPFELNKPDGKRSKIDLIAYDMIIDRMGRLSMATDDLGLVTADLISTPFENYHVVKTGKEEGEYNPISFFMDREM